MGGPEARRILMLTPNIGIGGAEKVFYQQGVYLSRNHPVKACAFSTLGVQQYFGAVEDVASLDALSGKGGAGLAARWAGRKRALESLHRSWGTEVCISHMEGANLLNAASGPKSLRRILCAHGSLLNDVTKVGARRWVFNRVLVPRLYNKADAVVPVAKGIADELHSLGVSRELLHPVPNYFDAGVIRQAMEEPLPMAHVWAGRTVLLNVGRLGREKNQRALISLFQYYCRHSPGACLLLVGDGPERDTLCTAAEGCGLRVYRAWADGDDPAPGAHDVYFLGSRMNPYPYMRLADVFLSTSTNEGFPLVLGEALTCGTAVVATDCPTGPREILSAKGDYAPIPLERGEVTDCGLLMPRLAFGPVSEGEARTWTEGIRLALDPAVRRGWQAAAAIKMQQYTLASVSRQWEALIAG